MKANRLIALALSLLLLLGVSGVSAFAMEIPEITMEPSDIDRQLSLIQSKAAGLKQPEGDMTWYYGVTDLDHNGNLEFIAAAQHPQNRSTNLRLWEVNQERTDLTECKLNKDPEESFPDILTDVADTYHNKSTDSWYYLLYDNIVISDNEVYSIKTTVRLADQALSYNAFAVEHTIAANGLRSVSHTDYNGAPISQTQYNAAGNDAMAGYERSSTNFEWLTAKDADNLTRLTDSFSVFMGQKTPTEVFPVPRPAVLNEPPSATPAPTTAPAPAQPQVFLSVTKNPTNENRTEGDTAYFVSAASAYESLSWTFVSPDGGEYSAQTMMNLWGNVSGQDSTTLTLSNVNTSMGGWGVYCTFYYKGQTARTTTAWLYVTGKSQPAPSGSYSAVVSDWTYSTVTLRVEGQVTVTVSRDICTIDGDLYSGAPAYVYWNGSAVTYCSIQGSRSDPPKESSINGYAHEGGAGYSIDLVNGKNVFVDSWKCNVSGSFYDGASCVVYFTEYPTTESVYRVDIYGSSQPSQGSMDGIASEAGGGYAIDLANGDQVYVDAWKCTVSGSFVDDSPCTVYYYGTPTSDNIYSANIYGSEAPVQGSMGGTAHEGGGGYAIDLENGDQVYVDSWKCNVNGFFYDGAYCIVYFNGAPTSDNIYSADIYGRDKPILYDHGDGLDSLDDYGYGFNPPLLY